jgi:hypothetical protein
VESQVPGIFVFAVVGLVAAWGVWQYKKGGS